MKSQPTLPESPALAAPPAPKDTARGGVPLVASRPASLRDARKLRRAGGRAHRRRRGQQLLLGGLLYAAALVVVALAWLFEALSIPGWTITIDDPR